MSLDKVLGNKEIQSGVIEVAIPEGVPKENYLEDFENSLNKYGYESTQTLEDKGNSLLYHVHFKLKENSQNA